MMHTMVVEEARGGSDHEKFTPSVLNSLCKKDLLTYLHIFINIEV